ncbi:MAG TPA: PHP domain-containing protein [Ktedonobacteraceae bacterium]|nr:PHP domain-containing protein [Ktedonobacteraceae bacterium]
MTITSDFHNHVVRSSPLSMVKAAQEKGLSILGLSEHDFQMRELRPILPHMPQEGPFLTFAEYIERVRNAAREAGFDVRLGLEVDFIPGKNEAIQAGLVGYDWDFLIGSVHQVGDLQFEDSRKWNREEGEQLWLRYFDLLRAAANSGYFSLISHPVRMRVGNPFLPSTFDQELEHLAAVAAEQDVALEINGYDMLHYPGLVRRLAKACYAQHTPISVGSDAHEPKGVAQAHAQTEQLLLEVGIERVRIWKQRVPEEYRINS